MLFQARIRGWLAREEVEDLREAKKIQEESSEGESGSDSDSEDSERENPA